MSRAVIDNVPRKLSLLLIFLNFLRLITYTFLLPLLAQRFLKDIYHLRFDLTSFRCRNDILNLLKLIVDLLN